MFMIIVVLNRNKNDKATIIYVDTDSLERGNGKEIIPTSGRNDLKRHRNYSRINRTLASKWSNLYRATWLSEGFNLLLVKLNSYQVGNNTRYECSERIGTHHLKGHYGIYSTLARGGSNQELILYMNKRKIH